MRTLPLVACLAAVVGVGSPSLRAQTSDLSPRAGAWGVEVSTGALYTASLLHFSTANAAWLVGASVDVGRETRDVPAFGGPATTETNNFASAVARIGRRWWRGDPASRIRPLVGLGLAGGLYDYSSQRGWSAGSYGELGATCFFSPRVSLGASTELDVNYARVRSSGGAAGAPDLVTRRWELRGDLARLAATVYF